MFNILINIVRKDRMVLITDSMRAGCIKSGVSELGGQKVIVKNGAARLEDGTLAGSVLTLNKAVLNMLRNSNLEIYDVVAMATINPAKVINMDDKIGSLRPGYDANIAIFNDDIDVYFTIVDGKIVYEA